MHLEIVPGESIGPFHLGVSLYKVLNHIRLERSNFPHIRVVWDADLTRSSIELRLQAPEMTLVFKNDRLEKIVVYSADLVYNGRSFQWTGDDQTDVIQGALKLFGPTYGLEPTESSEMHRLRYPGLDFIIAGDTDKTADMRIQEVVLVPQKSLKAQLDPVLDTPSLAYAKAAFGDVTRCDVNLDPVTSRFDHLVVNFFPSKESAYFQGIAPVTVRLHETTSEDLLVDFGSCTRTHFKEDQRMHIHQHVDSSKRGQNAYFMSYFDLGLSFLLDGSSHRVIKIILHSALPGCASFGRFARCNWVMTRGEKSVTSRSSEESIDKFLVNESPSTADPGFHDGCADKRKPLALDRNVDDYGTALSATELVGYPSLIFEYESGSVESLWIV